MSYSFDPKIIGTFGANYGAMLVAEMNKARSNPGAYTYVIRSRQSRLGLTNDEVVEAVNYLEKQPRCNNTLIEVPALDKIALQWAQHYGITGMTGHGDVASRISSVGKWSSYGEIISYNITDIQDIMTAWIVDRGIPGKGHRNAIFTCAFQQVGVGYASYPNYRNPVVVDFASGFISNT